MNELQDVRVDDATLLHGRDDGGEVVVGDDHGGGFLGHLRAPVPHRDADVRPLQRRSVVHPVPGHGHDLRVVLERLDDLQLLLRRHAGEDGGGRHDALPLRRVEVVEVASVHGLQGAPAGILVDPQLSSDRPGGRELVPGDHHRADTRVAAGRDGGPGLVAQRVLHAHEPDEGQVALEVTFSVGTRQLLVGQGQHPQARAGQLLVPVQEALAVSSRQGRDPGRGELVAARGEERSRRALHVGHGLPFRRVVHRDHALLDAVEGQLLAAPVIANECGVLEARLLGRDDQGGLRRIAEHRRAPLGALDLRVVAQRADPQGQPEVRRRGAARSAGPRRGTRRRPRSRRRSRRCGARRR